MANRNRTNPVQFYLSDDEQYILTTKFKACQLSYASWFYMDMCMMSITVICEIIIQSLDESVPV